LTFRSGEPETVSIELDRQVQDQKAAFKFATVIRQLRVGMTRSAPRIDRRNAVIEISIPSSFP
jgi:hypothetical protein